MTRPALHIEPLTYLLLVTFVYLVAALSNLFWLKFCRLELIQAGWLLFLTLPLTLPVLARRVGMRTFWCAS